MSKEPKYIRNINGDIADINIFDEIGEFGITGQGFADEIQALNDLGVKTIIIHNAGPGGSVMHGLAIFTSILNSKAETHMIIEGVAASMHGIIALAADKISMFEHGRLMVHAAKGSDNPDENEQTAIDSLNASIATILKARTKKTDAQIAELLNGETDTWLTPKQALAGGFIDERLPIEKRNQISARIPLDKIAAMLNPGKTYNGTNLANLLNKAIDEKETEDVTRNIIVNRIAAKGGIELSEVEGILSGSTKCKKLSYLEAFATELGLQIENVKSTAVKDDLRFDASGDLLDHNTKIINMKQLANLLGLNDEAAESAIIAAVQKVMNEGETARTDLATRTGELAKANETIADQKTTIEAFESKQTELNKTLVEETIEQGIKEGKFDKKDKDALVAQFKDNLPGLKLIVGKIKTGAVKITSQLTDDPGDNGDDVNITDEQKKWSYREWEKKDEKGLMVLKDSNPEYVNKLYLKQYQKNMPGFVPEEA